MTRITQAIMIIAAIVFLNTNIVAAVIGTTGSVVYESSPYPESSDDQIFVFDEQQGVAFTEMQSLDFGDIAEGTLVNSHYIQFDPTSPSGLVGGGSITFDGPILGVIVLTENLTQDFGLLGNSDSYFGLEDILGAYPTGDDPGARGLGSPEDNLVIVLGSTILTIDSLEIPTGPAAGNLDGFRVLTAAAPVPVPGALVLLASGLIGGLGFSRTGGRKKTRQ